jgi:hypothetical protein
MLMKLTPTVLLATAACVTMVGCARVAGQVYNDLNDGIYLKIYGKSGVVIAYGDLPGRRRLVLLETSDMIDRIEYTVGPNQSCKIDQSTFTKDIAVGRDHIWRIHLQGC